MTEQEARDFADVGKDMGDNVIRAAIKAARPIPTNNDTTPRESEWKPVDLWTRYEAPALPKHILPTVIERFAVAQADSMGVDPGGLAMSALAVCAAATSDRIRLQVKRHDPTWHESARLWVALIGTPSTKKTPMMTAAMRPLQKIDTQLFREFVIKQEIYDSLPAQERKSTPKPAQRRLRIAAGRLPGDQHASRNAPRFGGCHGGDSAVRAFAGARLGRPDRGQHGVGCGNHLKGFIGEDVPLVFAETVPVAPMAIPVAANVSTAVIGQ